MSVDIQLGTTVTPTWANVNSLKWNRVDTESGTTGIPTPVSTGTNFSYVKSFMVNITATGGLSMTAIKVGKLAEEPTTGTETWHTTEHVEGSYVQATAPPGATGDNNVTPPDINSGAAEAVLPLIAASVAYSAGPHSTTGRKGNLAEICLGVDFTNTSSGTTVATPTLRWQWTES